MERKDLEGTVGQRCTVDGFPGHGTMLFYGRYADKKRGGFRAGVKMDTAVGKNNGTVGGHQYFVCPDLHGILCDPRKITIIHDDEVRVKGGSKENTKALKIAQAKATKEGSAAAKALEKAQAARQKADDAEAAAQLVTASAAAAAKAVADDITVKSSATANKPKPTDIGKRVKINLPGLGDGLGVLAYCGPHLEKPGIYCGVVMDEIAPEGKRYGGGDYFDSKKGYGQLVKRKYVELCAVAKVASISKFAQFPLDKPVKVSKQEQQRKNKIKKMDAASKAPASKPFKTSLKQAGKLSEEALAIEKMSTDDGAKKEKGQALAASEKQRLFDEYLAAEAAKSVTTLAEIEEAKAAAMREVEEAKAAAERFKIQEALDEKEEEAEMMEAKRAQNAALDALKKAQFAEERLQKDSEKQQALAEELQAKADLAAAKEREAREAAEAAIRAELDVDHAAMEAQIGFSGLQLKKTKMLSTLFRSKKKGGAHPMIQGASAFSGIETEFDVEQAIKDDAMLVDDE